MNLPGADACHAAAVWQFGGLQVEHHSLFHFSGLHHQQCCEGGGGRDGEEGGRGQVGNDIGRAKASCSQYSKGIWGNSHVNLQALKKEIIYKS